MKDLKELIEKVIKDTRRNRLVWETITTYSDNYLETKAKIEYPDKLPEIVEVGLFRNPANESLAGVGTYGMKIGDTIVYEKQYAPLKKFGEYMFLDDLK